jgi:pyruvate/2-oxoglutarate dehydrogenase complex dihydrolipoamide acyltransferase (E2) component
MMPYILRSRNESCVYFEQKLDLTETLPYLHALNQRLGRTAEHEINLFHLILAAAARVFQERPDLNRFVSGGKLYQRRHIELSFALKKVRSDKGALTTTKLRYTGDESIADVADRTQQAISVGRSNKPNQSDKEMALLTRLPGPLLRLIMWLQRGLDAWNLLPKVLTEPDPLYASLFLANLGSIGIDSAYHHLFEYGSISFFAVIGRIGKLPFVDENGELQTRPGVSIKYTFDERITDGYYCARSLDLLAEYIEHPSRLDPQARTDHVPHSAE